MNKPPSLTPRWSKTIVDTYGTPPIGLVSGQGATLTDEEGKSYIDLLAGIAVNSLGYGNEQVAQAVSHQARTLVHLEPLCHAAGARRRGEVD